MYVRAFTTFTAALGCLVPSAYPDIRTFIHDEGYSALLTEREVFEANAAKRGVSIPVISKPSLNPVEENDAKSSITVELKQGLHPACYEYANWMMSCVSDDHENVISFATLLLLLWGIEKCYYEAFLFVKESAKFTSLDLSVKNFVEWWTAPEFRNYINKLEGIFERVQKDEVTWDLHAARALFKVMLIYESQFWNSTISRV